MLAAPVQVIEAEEEKPIRRRARTLGDVRDILSRSGAGSSAQVKLQLSAINTVARASGCSPEDIPADPALLRQHLATISPAMAGLTRGSWASVRSRILKGLQGAQVQVMAARRTEPLRGEWAELYGSLRETGKKAALSRFIGWLSDRGVPPEQVCDGWVDRFKAEIETSSLRGDPRGLIRQAIRGWNAAALSITGWPPQQLTDTPPDRKGYVLPLADFPESFQRSVSDYLAFLVDPPLDNDEAPLRGLRPTTLRLREFQFRQMASALVIKGVRPEIVTGISSLAARDKVDLICEFFAERSGRPNCSQIEGLLSVLRAYARHQMRDREAAEWLARRIRRLFGSRSSRFGLTQKNRRRLAVFRDPAQVRDLLLLPYKLLKRAESGVVPAAEAARLMRAAVAVELEVMCPIRLHNLAEINVDIDFVRSHARKNAPVHLFIPGSRTKNGEDIELELPRQSMALIDIYLAKSRSQFIDPEHRGRGPRFLFPRSNGSAKPGRILADGVCRVLERELGIKFNIHLFRHLGCFLYLKSHPGQVDVMRRVLGHRDIDTTMRFYAHVEQSDAFRQFDQHVLQIREEALNPGRRRSSSVRRGARP